MRIFLRKTLTLLFICLPLCLAAIDAGAQTRRTGISEAISRIEQTSGYTFFYNAEDIAGLTSSNVNLSGPIDTVLEALFKGTGIEYRIQGNEIVLKKIDASAQGPKTQANLVRGNVKDLVEGLAVIGAGIIIEGTQNGTYTNLDGNFVIEAGPNDVLVVSSLGYKTIKVPVRGRNRLDIALDMETSYLEEVVALGYSSLKRTELSSSAVSVQGEALRDVTTPDLGNMLQGKVAGVLVFNATGQPGEAAQIRIRGTGSISASAEPLYVVDGIPGGSFNPNDVESLTVLKEIGRAHV